MYRQIKAWDGGALYSRASVFHSFFMSLRGLQHKQHHSVTLPASWWTGGVNTPSSVISHKHTSAHILYLECMHTNTH